MNAESGPLAAVVEVAPELREMLEALIENEQVIADYYALMMDYFGEHRAAWSTLRDQELSHVRTLEHIREAVTERPDLFSVGKRGVGAVRMMIADVRSMIDKLQRREVHPRYALTFAIDFESSLIESRLDQAIATDVVEVRRLLGRLQEETLAHQALLRTISA